MSVLRIKDLCREKGVSQKALAELLELREDSFSTALKKDSLSIAKLEKIAEALGVSIPELFEVPQEGAAVVRCPHCGKPINLKVE